MSGEFATCNQDARFPGDPGARPAAKLMSEKLPQAIFPMD
jgi:hypothetical protein